MLVRYRVILEGFSGAPGYSIFHLENSDAAKIQEGANLIHNAYDGIKAYLLGGMTVKLDAEGLEIEPSTGKLKAVHAVTPPAVITGQGVSSAIPRSTMATVRHHTDAVIVNGHRLAGRTFVGPLDAAAIGNDGNIKPQAVIDFGAMWDGLQDVTGWNRLMVYHRPRKSADGVSLDDGTAGHVQSSTCNVKPGGLRSRRD